MKFNLDNYKGKYVMHCRTLEEAESFFAFLHKNGKKWSTKDSYLQETSWSVFKERTCYLFNNGTYDKTQSCIIQDYTILEWEDFMKDTISTNNIIDENTNKKYVRIIDNYNGVEKVYKLSQNILDFLKEVQFDFDYSFLCSDIEYDILIEPNQTIKEF